MTPLIEPFPAVDPQGRSYGVLADDTSRSGIPAGLFAKQELLLTGSPTGGTFTLSFGGTAEVDSLTPNETFTAGSFVFSFVVNGVTYTTAPVLFSATNGELQAALRAATGPSGQTLSAAVTVAEGPVASAKTKLTWAAALGPVTEFKVVVESPTPATAKLAVARTTSGAKVTTSALPFEATAAEVQVALRALSTVGGANLTVAGANGGPYTVTFAGTLTGPQPLITGNGASLTTGTQYQEGQIVTVPVVTGFAPTVITATGTSTAFAAGDLAAIAATVNASAVTGTTPSLTLKLEGSDDGTNFFQVGQSFAAMTEANKPQQETFEVEAWTQLRWAWTVSGTTPSFTLSVTTAAKLTGNA